MKQTNNEPLRQKLLSRVLWTPGCWGWAGRVDAHGRPRIDAGGRDWLARRVSWEMHYGSVPPGKLVLHNGPDKQCIRPECLFLGTYRDKTTAAMTPLVERYW